MFELIGKLRILLTPRDKYALVGLLLAMVFGALLELVGVSILMPMLAVFTKPELLYDNAYVGKFFTALAAGKPERVTVLLCIAVMVFYVVKNAYALFLIHIQARFLNRKGAELTDRLFANYLEMSYALHLKHGFNELLYKKGLLLTIVSQIMMPLLLITSEIMVIGFIMALLLAVQPVLTLSMAALVLPLMLGLYWAFRRLNYVWGQRANEYESAAQAFYVQSLYNIKETKIFQAGPYFQARFARANAWARRLSAQLTVLGQMPRFAIETVMILLAMGALLCFVLSGMGSARILMIITMYLAALYRLLPSLTRLHYNLVQIRQAAYVFNTLYTDLIELPKAAAPAVHHHHAPESGRLAPLQKEIRLDDVNFRYENGVGPVIHHFSLTIPAFSSVAFVGPTGCGKTTLIDLIAGLLTPDSGRITVDGTDIAEARGDWQSQLGYVPQSINLTDGTLRENVAWGVENPDDAQVRRALELAQLTEFVRTLPRGLDTVLGDAGMRLSGGQRQRLGIARALYRQPGVLILDEATSALDPETEAAFISALQTLRGHCTLLVISHRLSTVADCDRIIRLDTDGMQCDKAE